ncbi:MAG: hypothetical protein ACFE0O_00445 [Opitutales bacterium]
MPEESDTPNDTDPPREQPKKIRLRLPRKTDSPDDPAPAEKPGSEDAAPAAEDTASADAAKPESAETPPAPENKPRRLSLKRPATPKPSESQATEPPPPEPETEAAEPAAEKPQKDKAPPPPPPPPPPPRSRPPAEPEAPPAAGPDTQPPETPAVPPVDQEPAAAAASADKPETAADPTDAPQPPPGLKLKGMPPGPAADSEDDEAVNGDGGDDPEAETAEPESPETKKKNGPSLLPVLLLLFLFFGALGGTVWFFFLRPDPAPEPIERRNVVTRDRPTDSGTTGPEKPGGSGPISTTKDVTNAVADGRSDLNAVTGDGEEAEPATSGSEETDTDVIVAGGGKDGTTRITITGEDTPQPKTEETVVVDPAAASDLEAAAEQQAAQERVPPDPEIRNYIRNLRITGVMESRQRIQIGAATYERDMLVDSRLGIFFLGVKNGILYFQDTRGALYTKEL